jgi:hypothetical protein
MTKMVPMSDETYERLKDEFEEKAEPMNMASFTSIIGRQWFIRTVTYHLVGKVVYRHDSGDGHTFLQLVGAAWVASSGRFMNAIKDGTLDEVEPVGDALVNVAAITDMFPWNHPLPTKQK